MHIAQSINLLLCVWGKILSRNAAWLCMGLLVISVKKLYHWFSLCTRSRLGRYIGILHKASMHFSLQIGSSQMYATSIIFTTFTWVHNARGPCPSIRHTLKSVFHQIPLRSGAYTFVLITTTTAITQPIIYFAFSAWAHFNQNVFLFYC